MVARYSNMLALCLSHPFAVVGATHRPPTERPEGTGTQDDWTNTRGPAMTATTKPMGTTVRIREGRQKT
jgi:hypothetical protein